MWEAAEFGFEGVRGFAVGIVHSGFMYSEMTKGGLISVGIRRAIARRLKDFFSGPSYLSRPLCCFLFLLLLSVTTTTGISYGRMVGAILT